MMEAALCSPGTLCHFREESSDEGLSVLPRHTKVIVTGNNRTKPALVGLQGVVKKAVGLGGWHWLVLKNGVEVKLQRNALSVLEAPTGNEEDDDIDCDNSLCSSSDMGEKDIDFSLEFQKTIKPRIRHAKSSSHSTKNSRSSCRSSHSQTSKPQTRVNLAKLRTTTLWKYWKHFDLRVNLAKLGTTTLWRYWKHFDLVSINPNPTTEQLIRGVQHHFLSQQLDEVQVIVGFIRTAKRLKNIYSTSL